MAPNAPFTAAPAHSFIRIVVIALLCASTVYPINHAGKPCNLTNFLAAPEFVVASEPHSIVSEDFDGDGKVDVATVSNTLTVSVLRNTGSSGSAQFAPRIDFPLTSGALGITVGDFDGDGRKDIVTANYFSSTISVLRNTSEGVGSVEFAPVVSFGVGGSPRSAAAADINNDLKLDIVVANQSSNSVSVLINTGLTTGSIDFAVAVNFNVGLQPRQVAVGDFDGDSKTDIAAVNYQASTVSVLRNTTITSSNVTFAPKVDFAVGISGGFSDSSALVVSDFDGDGKIDVAATNMGPRYVSVLRNTSTGNGSISFATRVNFRVGFGGYSIIARDLDADTKVDLATANFYSNNVSILRNTSVPGTISFAIRIEFGIGASPTGIAGADFDSDGRFDLALSNSKSGSISLLRSISAPPEIRYHARPEFAIGGEIPLSVEVVDIDNDDKADTVTANFGTNNISVLRNLSMTGDHMKFDQSIDIPGGNNSRPSWIDSGDLDSDRKPDLVITNSQTSSVSVFRNTSKGGVSITFAGIVDFSVGSNPAFVNVNDLDGDGRVDLSVVNRGSDSVSILRNTTSGPGDISFGPHVLLNVNNEPSSLVSTDLDGDGKPDLVVTNFIDTTISVFRNTSTAGMVSFAAKEDIAANLNPYSVATGDFDSDGGIDLAVTSSVNDNAVISIFRSTSSTPGIIQFAPKVDITIVANPPFPSIASGPMVVSDFNNDSKDDIVVKTGSISAVSLLRNTTSGPGNINFAPRIDTNANQAGSVSVNDFDRNGGQDVVYAGVNSDNVGILQNPCSSIQNTAFDYDGDGKSDLSVYRPSNQNWYVFGSTAGFTTTSWGILGDQIAPADYDGDGKTDVAVWRPSDGKWYVIYSDDFTITESGWGLDGDVPVPGDYDGDGTDDLAVFRPSENKWYVRNSGGTFSTTEFGLAGDKPVVGDFDGDGKNDLAVYRPSDNNWYLLRTTAGFTGFQWGLPGDLIAPADYDGDGSTDVAVWRPIEGRWYWIASSDLSLNSRGWGLDGDVPVPADYDGDGKADQAVFRPSENKWYFFNSSSGLSTRDFGLAGDKPTQTAFIQ